MTKNNTTQNTSAKPGHMWTSPKGWFKATHDARDTEAVFRSLVEENQRRLDRGLPPFTPSYELAARIVANRAL